MTTQIDKPSKECPQTLNVFPDIVHIETTDLTPTYDTDIDESCHEIKAACKGWGTNNKRLIAVMTSLSPVQRHWVSLRYKELYGKELHSYLKKEAGSSAYGQLLQYLVMSPVDAEATMVKDACDGIGSNEMALYTICCGRSNEDMNLLKRCYYKAHSDDMTERINSEIGGDLQLCISSCMQGAEEKYDEDYHTESRALEDATTFYEAGQGRWFGTDEKSLFKLVALSPPKYLNRVNQAYAAKYGYTLFKAMEKELSGDAEDAALYMLGMKLQPHETVAKLIKKACKGLGTNELLLSACLVRYTHLLVSVNVAHVELYEKTLIDRVKGECSGKYKDVLVGLLNSVIPEE